MYKYVQKKKKKKSLPSIVHDIWKSAQAPKFSIVTKLKNENCAHWPRGRGIVQDVHVRGGKKSYKNVWMSEREEYCNVGWMLWINAPQWCAWQKRKRKKEKRKINKGRQFVSHGCCVHGTTWSVCFISAKCARYVQHNIPSLPSTDTSASSRDKRVAMISLAMAMLGVFRRRWLAVCDCLKALQGGADPRRCAAPIYSHLDSNRLFTPARFCNTQQRESVDPFIQWAA